MHEEFGLFLKESSICALLGDIINVPSGFSCTIEFNCLLRNRNVIKIEVQHGLRMEGKLAALSKVVNFLFQSKVRVIRLASKYRLIRPCSASSVSFFKQCDFIRT